MVVEHFGCWCGNWEICRVAAVVGNFAVLRCQSGISPCYCMIVPVWFSRISPGCYNCREFRRVVTIVGNVVRVALSGISPCCYYSREFRSFLMVFVNFAVLLRFFRISPCCYGSREFRRASRVAAVLGKFADLLNTREFRRVATVVESFAVLRWLLEVSPCCYSDQDFRRVATVLGKFAMLLRIHLRQIFLVVPCCYVCRAKPSASLPRSDCRVAIAQPSA